MINYEPIVIIINIMGLVKVIVEILMRYYGFSDSIISERYLVFTLKFDLYFLTF